MIRWILFVAAFLGATGCDREPAEGNDHDALIISPVAQHPQKQLEAETRQMETRRALARLSDAQRDELQALISAGRKIEAVTLYRSSSGANLLLAKDVIDTVERHQDK